MRWLAVKSRQSGRVQIASSQVKLQKVRDGERNNREVREGGRRVKY